MTFLTFFFLIFIRISIRKTPVSPKALELLHWKPLSQCIFVSTQTFPRVHEPVTHTITIPQKISLPVVPFPILDILKRAESCPAPKSKKYRKKKIFQSIKIYFEVHDWKLFESFHAPNYSSTTGILPSTSPNKKNLKRKNNNISFNWKTIILSCIWLSGIHQRTKQNIGSMLQPRYPPNSSTPLKEQQAFVVTKIWQRNSLRGKGETFDLSFSISAFSREKN